MIFILNYVLIYTFTNKDLLKAFIVSNFNGIDHSYIDRFINDNFLEINAVSKSLIRTLSWKLRVILTPMILILLEQI